MVAYLALGSNLGDRRATIESAVARLAALGQVAAVSSIYETEPEGGARQPRYLNAAVRLVTTLSAFELLRATLDIEEAHGRVRPAGQPKAPRTLDIDLLLVGDQVIASPTLAVPHPSLLARPFVRIPLADVALPGLRHPRNGEPLDVCAPDPTVRRIA